MLTPARLALVGALAATPVLAHHGWSRYDASKTMTVEGPVLTSNFGNPHGSLTIEHAGKRWEVILAPPSRMTARGLAEADIAAGKTVTIVGYPHTGGDPEMRAERITAGQKTVELR